MAVPQYSPNHVVNPETGFLENPAFANNFDSQKKNLFFKLFYENGLRIRRTCDELGVSIDTVNRHYHIDPKFKQLYDEVKDKYLDELEGVSRINALNPRSVIERIFQLKCLLPEKYGQENRPQNLQITVNLDANLMANLKERQKSIDAEIVKDNVLATVSSVSDDC